jgi:hypothetical protein
MVGFQTSLPRCIRVSVRLLTHPDLYHIAIISDLHFFPHLLCFSITIHFV